MNKLSKFAGRLAALAALVLSLLCAAAPAYADPYSETSGPADAPAAMIVVHGGGWVWTGAPIVQATRVFAQRYADRMLTLNVDYRPGGPQGLEDVLGFYDRLRAQRGPDFPICLSGESAGGQLAVMVAARRPDVACVVNEAGPVDLRAAAPALTALINGAFQYDPAVIAANDPMQQTAQMRAPMLLAYTVGDPMVPVQEGRDFHAAYPNSTLVELPSAAEVNHIHSQTSVAALNAFHEQERGWVDQQVAAWRTQRSAATTPAVPAPAAAPAAAQQVKAPKAKAAPRKRSAKRQKRSAAKKHRSAKRTHRVR